MLCFHKFSRYLRYSRSVFITAIERSHRYIYSASSLPEIPESFSKDLKTLNELWEGKYKLDEIDNFLFKCFSKELDCYSFTLDMIKYSDQGEFKQDHELNFAIILAFDSWLKQNAVDQPLTTEIKQKALELAISHKFRKLSRILSNVYKFQDDTVILREYVDKLTLAKNYEEACCCVTALGIQKAIPFEKILLPLMYKGKIGFILSYLQHHTDLQLEFAKTLDAAIHNPLKEYGYTSIKQKENNIICRCLRAIIKNFNLPSELFPNMIKFKSAVTMHFLFSKKLAKSIPDDSWESLIVNVVQNYPDLQKKLINKLVASKDIIAATKIASRFNFNINDWPVDSIKSDENTSNPAVSGKKSVLKNEGKNFNEYLSLDVNEVPIQFVQNKEEFFDCLSDINQNHKIVGVDSEWKIQFGFGPLRLSLMQLAVSNKVYLLDMLSLDECLIEENWNSLMDLFSNPQILKLGCGFLQDVQMLVENYKGTPNKSIHFSHILDVAVLFDQLQEYYEEELKEFANDPPGTKGLSKLCKMMLGKHLNKGERICDWELRPLSDSQVTYAALDAHCLLEIFNKMETRVTKHSVDFEKLVVTALGITARFSKLNLRSKKKYRWQQHALNFSYHPLVKVNDFKVIVDYDLMALAMKLRVFGVDVSVLKVGETYIDGVKIASDGNRVYLATEDHIQEVKSRLSADKYHLISEQAKHDENTVAHIFGKYNVHLESRAIFSRCMYCNKADFLPIPSDVLKEMWMTANSKNSSLSNCTQENSDCDHKLYEYEETSVNDKGILNTGVQIQLEKVPFGSFLDVPTFHVCKNCGNVHYRR